MGSLKLCPEALEEIRFVQVMLVDNMVNGCYKLLHAYYLVDSGEPQVGGKRTSPLSLDHD